MNRIGTNVQGRRLFDLAHPETHWEAPTFSLHPWFERAAPWRLGKKPSYSAEANDGVFAGIRSLIT